MHICWIRKRDIIMFLFPSTTIIKLIRSMNRYISFLLEISLHNTLSLNHDPKLTTTIFIKFDTYNVCDIICKLQKFFCKSLKRKKIVLSAIFISSYEIFIRMNMRIIVLIQSDLLSGTWITYSSEDDDGLYIRFMHYYIILYWYN